MDRLSRIKGEKLGGGMYKWDLIIKAYEEVKPLNYSSKNDNKKLYAKLKELANFYKEFTKHKDTITKMIDRLFEIGTTEEQELSKSISLSLHKVHHSKSDTTHNVSFCEAGDLYEDNKNG